MNKEKLLELIKTPEDEYHDFKEMWYSTNKKDELVKDIFSFVNTVHHSDCYLIFGVTDNQKVTGINETERYYNKQKLIDFFNKLPICNSMIPKIFVDSFDIDGKIVDVLTISDTRDVPIYLTQEYRKEVSKSNHVIFPGQVFSREGDTNTSLDSTTLYPKLELLWKKKLGLDLSIKEKYIDRLKKIDNWEYREVGQHQELRYKLDTDYCIYVSENEFSEKISFESFACNQDDVDVSFQNISFKYKDKEIFFESGCYLDSGRFLTVTPDHGFINSIGINPYVFDYFIKGTVEYYLEKILLNGSGVSVISPNDFEKQRLLSNVLILDNENQINEIESFVKSNYARINKEIKPSDDEVEIYMQKAKFKSQVNGFSKEYFCKIYSFFKLNEFLFNHQNSILSYDAR